MMRIMVIYIFDKHFDFLHRVGNMIFYDKIVYVFYRESALLHTVRMPHCHGTIYIWIKKMNTITVPQNW